MRLRIALGCSLLPAIPRKIIVVVVCPQPAGAQGCTQKITLPAIPTLVFPNGTCRVPILHPPAPKVLVRYVSRSKIAPCGCKVAVPGTRRKCRSVPTPWNPLRTLNRAPSSKLPSWNASRLSHSSSHSICILRIEYNHVVGLWRSTPLGFLRNQSCLPSAKGLLDQRHTRYAVRTQRGRRPPDASATACQLSLG
jgi:hypothetical protein